MITVTRVRYHITILLIRLAKWVIPYVEEDDIKDPSKVETEEQADEWLKQRKANLKERR